MHISASSHIFPSDHSLVWCFDPERSDFFASEALCEVLSLGFEGEPSDLLSFSAYLNEVSQTRLQQALDQVILSNQNIEIPLYLLCPEPVLFHCRIQALRRSGRRPLLQGLMWPADAETPFSGVLGFRSQVEALGALWFDNQTDAAVRIEKALEQALVYLSVQGAVLLSWSAAGVKVLNGWQTELWPEQSLSWHQHLFNASDGLAIWGKTELMGEYRAQPLDTPLCSGFALRLDLPLKIEACIVFFRVDQLPILLNDSRLQFGRMLASWLSYLQQKEYSFAQVNDLRLQQEHLLSMLAHDIRNALSSILGGSHLLLRRQWIAPEGTEVVDFMQRSGQYILSLLQEVLAIGELELEETTRGFASFEMNRALIPLISSWDEQAAAMGVQLRTHLSSEPLRLSLNSAWFERLVEHILSNACKFTPAGGEVILSTSLHEEGIVLEIRDNGIGIPLELQPQLFECFTSSRRQGLRGEKATGVGMYLIEKITHLHRGRLSLESQEDFGTTLRLIFPGEV